MLANTSMELSGKAKLSEISNLGRPWKGTEIHVDVGKEKVDFKKIYGNELLLSIYIK